MNIAVDPPRDCVICPRLAAFRAANRAMKPDWFNAPVPGFGVIDGRLAIIGLAPGLQGANRTGRPFTGDYAGDLLYGTLIKFGFAKGHYAATPDDGLQLVDCRIINAVRCVPPQNKPTGPEISACRRFLTPALSEMKRLECVVALGRIAHESLIRALGHSPAKYKFGHGASHQIDRLRLYDSYHCSRYNTNTGKLTTPMFESVFAEIRRSLG